ncbi:hypothetical protein HELRODRAFT_161986 [Helobdella robusta]|uniref:Uncharacterized protein n=1 Tax=Helobdella robusta TaxID=6412 RepID=T1ES44_HELRO|nr:hypothetical protein HELRODRAFT_161986 [Helobdella robusta]ESO02693.1 hypothetical protein HELRODRAFT_161986 [Helobdella robusta]
MDKFKTDELTRYLKAVQDIKPTDFEILQALIKADIDPEEISSVTRLRGSRSGVIRVRMKTRNSLDVLDDQVKKRKISIGGVVLGAVSECGYFVKVVLENVPMCITDSDVEDEMRKYGSVIKSEKQYLDYAGCRIANEKRIVLFSAINKGTSLQNARIPICGSTVFSSIIPQASDSKQLTTSAVQPAVQSAHVAARRKSFGAIPLRDNNEPDLEDDWMVRLERRRSFKVKQAEGQMSSVAYRQSTVFRDVEKNIVGGGYDILTSKDLKTQQQQPHQNSNQMNKDEKVGKVENESSKQEDDEDRNKLSWLKAFDKRRSSKKLAFQVDKTTKNLCLNQELKSKIEEKLDEIKRKQKAVATPSLSDPSKLKNNLKLPDFKSQKKVNWISKKIPEIRSITSSNVAKKPKSCNESFVNFLEMRRKQKRADAFEQLSANLI